MRRNRKDRERPKRPTLPPLPNVPTRRDPPRQLPTTNSPMNDRHANPIGRPGEAGIIHEVYVKNFMCHRKLSLKLCRNVNFIHGQNGSGKSAILRAIQVCLGAGAHMMHRARNLKDLVRKEAGADCSAMCCIERTAHAPHLQTAYGCS